MLQLAIILAVLGPSQFGKSSFINFLSGLYSLTVGTGDGISTTLEVQEVRAPDPYRLFPEGAEIRFLDVPGYGDSDLRLMDEQISESIKYRLVGMDSRKLDVLFVFQSIAESTMSLRSTFVHAEEMFGPSILQSTIVVLTKRDLVVPSMIEKRMGTIDNICRPKHIPYITWVNNSTDSVIDEEQLSKQFADLKAALTLVQPYEMEKMETYERKVEKLAREMMDNDLANNITRRFSMPSHKVHTYNETVNFTFSTLQRTYSDAEVGNIAKVLAPGYRKIPIADFCTREVEAFDYEIVTENKTISYTNWILFFPIENNISYQTQTLNKKIFKQNITEPCIKFVDTPIQEIEDILRREMKEVNATTTVVSEKVRLESSIEDVNVTIPLRDLGYYKAKVALQLSQAKWKKD